MYFSFPFLTYLSGCNYKGIAVLILLKHTDNAQMSLSENEVGCIQYCVCLGNVICLEPWKVLNNIMQKTDMSGGRMWIPRSLSHLWSKANVLFLQVLEFLLQWIQREVIWERERRVISANTAKKNHRLICLLQYTEISSLKKIYLATFVHLSGKNIK